MTHFNDMIEAIRTGNGPAYEKAMQAMANKALLLESED